MNPASPDVSAQEQAQSEITALKNELDKANREYYILDKPSLSDDEYDALMRRLVELETQFPDLITPDSPTQRVGAPLESDFEKVAHAVPMLSLKDVRGEKELLEWEKSLRRHVHLSDDAPVEYICEPKIDGLSAALIYENGVYVRGLTRGNGQVGEDVTVNLRTLRTIPNTLTLDPEPPIFEVRGEVYMLRSEFIKLNQKLAAQDKPLLANPRNTAAGSLRQKDPKVTASRPLTFAAYSLGVYEGVVVKTQWELLETLTEAGLRVNPLRKKCASMDEVRAFIEWFDGVRDDLDYATDGVVVKVNDFALQNELGYVGRNPRWACAFKFPPKEVVTVVENISVEIGRLGTMTPKAFFKPVEVAGTTVIQATLHNEEQLRKKDVRIGDTVVIRKAGEIIPEVLRVLAEARTGQEVEFVFPTHCPSCSTEIVKEGPIQRCPNKKCPARLERAVEHFVGRDRMNIDGVGIELGKTFIAAGLVKDLADLFFITKPQLLELERMADKSAQNVLDSLERAKHPTLAGFLFALGVPNVGQRTAELIAEKFGTLEALRAAKEEEIAGIHEVGKVAGKSLREWLDDEENIALLDKFTEAGVVPVAVEKREADARFAGKVFVFTGSMELDRRTAENMVKDLGARAGGSVSKKTDYVVAGENAGSKLDRARELKIPILTEEEFLALIAPEESEGEVPSSDATPEITAQDTETSDSPSEQQPSLPL